MTNKSTVTDTSHSPSNGTRYDPAFKQMVCQRLMSTGADKLTVSQAAKEFHVSACTLYNWLHSLPYSPLPESRVTQVPVPPLPQGITTLPQALYVSMHCEHLGFTSAEAKLYCHQQGYELSEIEQFSQTPWFTSFANEQQLLQFPSMVTTLRNRDADNPHKEAELRSAIKQNQDVLAKQDQLIADLTQKLNHSKEVVGNLGLISRLKGQGCKVSTQDRQQTLEIVDTLREETNASTEDICEVLGISARTYYRWRNDPDGEDKRATCTRKPSLRNVSPERKQLIIAKFTDPAVAGLSVGQAYNYYLAQGECYASLSTVRRILREHEQQQAATDQQPNLHTSTADS